MINYAVLENAEIKTETSIFVQMSHCEFKFEYLRF